MLIQQIKNIAKRIHPDIIGIRRHLHAHPELSFEEYNTSHYIQHILDSYQIEFSKGWVKTGIVAHIKGKNAEKRTIALRADMDALPIQEASKCTYASTMPGIMHACGHDVHSASLLGTCMILNELKDEFEGTVKIIFQPGEEKLPGGAKLLIEEGGLKNPDAELIIGQHVFPEMEVGKVGFRAGTYMASTDEIHILVSGRGGHAALPHQYDYSTMAASELIVNCNAAFERMKNHLNPAVLAFGRIIAMGATNVIPAEVKIEGTLRCLNEEFRSKVHAVLKEQALMITSKFGSKVDLRIEKGYPVLINNESITQACIKTAQEFMGADKVEELEIRMTAEDFAYYSQVIPSCFYRLGTGNKSKGIDAPVHTSTFDIDEDALEIGSGLMAYMAIKMLN